MKNKTLLLTSFKETKLGMDLTITKVSAGCGIVVFLGTINLVPEINEEDSKLIKIIKTNGKGLLSLFSFLAMAPLVVLKFTGP
jgi:hypothetical protein